jgi:uncharacterized damage-inducible protein DinB
MITPAYCQTMARYNAWQNHSLYMAANGLDEAAREADRGAFWGGIRTTLAHLMWADMLWIARLDGGEGPSVGVGEAAGAYDWVTLWQARPKLDARIAAWAWMVLPEDLEGDLTWYSGFLGHDMTRPRGLCVMQLFNHQTHHRGQVHAMLTAAGARPDDTDLQLLPEDVPEWR